MRYLRATCIKSHCPAEFLSSAVIRRRVVATSYSLGLCLLFLTCTALISAKGRDVQGTGSYSKPPYKSDPTGKLPTHTPHEL